MSCYYGGVLDDDNCEYYIDFEKTHDETKLALINLSNNEKMLAIGSIDRSDLSSTNSFVKIIYLDDSKADKVVNTATTYISVVLFSPDDTKLVAASSSKFIVYDVSNDFSVIY